MPNEYVAVEGLSELNRAFGRVEKGLRRELTRRLRTLAREVVDVAKAKAAGQGFAPPGRSGRGTGRLIRDIKASVRAGQAFIRESAVNPVDGYPYTRRFEFSHAAKWSRPFMFPAADEMRPRVVEGMEQMLDSLLEGEFMAGV